MEVLQDVQLSGFGNGLGAFVDEQLAVDIFNVGAYRVQADHDLIGNLIVSQALCHQLQDFDFAVGKGLDERGGGE